DEAVDLELYRRSVNRVPAIGRRGVEGPAERLDEPAELGGVLLKVHVEDGLALPDPLEAELDRRRRLPRAARPGDERAGPPPESTAQHRIEACDAARDALDGRDVVAGKGRRYQSRVELKPGAGDPEGMQPFAIGRASKLRHPDVPLVAVAPLVPRKL